MGELWLKFLHIERNLKKNLVSVQTFLTLTYKKALVRSWSTFDSNSLIFKSACPTAHFVTSNEVLGQDITKYDYLIWHSSKKIKCNQSTVFFFHAFGSMPDINSLNSNEVSSSFLKPLLNKSFTRVFQGKIVPKIVLRWLFRTTRNISHRTMKEKLK